MKSILVQLCMKCDRISHYERHVGKYRTVWYRYSRFTTPLLGRRHPYADHGNFALLMVVRSLQRCRFALQQIRLPAAVAL